MSLPVAAAAPEGLDKGYFVRPTILADVDPDSTIAQEEVFGPVLSILSYRTTTTPSPSPTTPSTACTAAVWSADRGTGASAVAMRMRTGSVDINGAAYNPMAPFGGYKHSGVGREMGAAGLEEYLETKSVGLR